MKERGVQSGPDGPLGLRPIKTGRFARMAGRAAVLTAMLFLLTSCIYPAVFLDLSHKHKKPIWGTYNTLTRKIKVTLPSGERFVGKYFPLDPDSLGGRKGSYFSRVDISTFLGLTGPSEGWKDWHAFLTGDHGTKMEVIFRYNNSQTAGHGAARTDSGGEYRVVL